MSTLRLRIHKHLGGQQGPPQIYASIRSINKSGGRDKNQPVLEELIPVSDNPDKAKALEVTPGHYYVEAVLPSGELLYEDVVVKSDQTTEVVLKPDDSPHEWLSWQQISGNVQPSYKAKKIRSSTSTRRRRPGAAPGEMRAAKHLELDLDEIAASINFMPEPEPEVRVQSPIQWLTEPHPTLSEGQRSGSWKFLSSLTGTSAAALIHALNNRKPPTQVSPAVSDKAHGVFRVSSAPVPGSGVVVRPIKANKRTYVAIPRRFSVELVSIPLPWKVVSTHRPADIEIIIQEPSDPSAFCSSAIARDKDCGPLLGFLSSGSLPAVRRLAETGKEKLYYKFENPFAAAAGAYALVGTAQHATDRDWHQWVRNLKDNFPYISDGAIQWGQLMLRMRRSSDDVAEAVNAFKTAFNRGLPFYSMGIKWLLEGLEWAGADDPQAKLMADHVRPIAWRTNYRQAFTTLRIGDNSNV
jgi:hypothetical protein